MDVFRCGWSQQLQEQAFLWWLDSSFMAPMLESDRRSKNRSSLQTKLSLSIDFKSRPIHTNEGGFYR